MSDADDEHRLPSFGLDNMDEGLRARVGSVAGSAAWLAALDAVLRDARSGVLEANWRECRPEMALLGLRDAATNPEPPVIPPPPYEGTNPFAGLGELRVYRKPRWQWETEYFALLEIVGTPVWAWEPAVNAGRGWVHALGAWYALSLECVNTRAILAMQQLSYARAANAFMPLVALREDPFHGSFERERDLLTESYEAGLCAGGWTHADCMHGVDWIGNAHRRTACWRDETERDRHLAELDSADYRARLERLPHYWRPPPNP